MDLKSKIIDIYKKKITLLKKHNKLYFENDDPKISDAEYDILKREIINLEEKNNFLKKLNLNKVIIGSSPSNKFKKVKHKVLMLSLSNAFSENDLINFQKKIINFLDQRTNFEIEYSAEPKIDGISASLFYKNGFFVKGLSRGDGKEGEA